MAKGRLFDFDLSLEELDGGTLQHSNELAVLGLFCYSVLGLFWHYATSLLAPGTQPRTRLMD